MSYLNRKTNYDKYPVTNVQGYDSHAYQGYDSIMKAIQKKLSASCILVVDCYPGVNDEEVLSAFVKGLNPDYVIESKQIFYEEKELNTRMKPFLTEDRVRGVMFYGSMNEFVDQRKLEKVSQSTKEKTGLTLIYGVGASLIAQGDVLVYADLARWEIQMRFRKGLPNFNCSNPHEDILLKYKRAFFVEWRIADQHKKMLYDKIDFFLDTNIADNPKMVSGEAFCSGLKCMTNQPFRLVPYFDPGVWGGQWMKEVCDLDKNQDNYAWSFDGVPEENSIYLKFGDITIESPAMNVVQYVPEQLLGKKNYERFGTEFPIRFDFLDTMEGQNLSLQVHPLTQYIKDRFGMKYTQDESYYILDCKEGGGVYLGLKENIDRNQMMSDLREAQTGNTIFDADKYVNCFPAKKHDHFLIPAGTIHCSTKDTMVLEISATPYNFTFKLWDWNRVGLDGLPRPIHIDDGENVIQWNRDTKWVKEHLVNDFSTLHDDSDYVEVKTGLHELEFIETRVISSSNKTFHHTQNEVNMLNLVEGDSIVVESPTNKFQSYIVHYVETFIIPANVEEYTIRPTNAGSSYKVLKAYVRN